MPMSKHNKSKLNRHLVAVAVVIAGLAAIPKAIASTQPFSTENPFETDIPSAINNSGSSGVNGIDVGEPSIGDILPSFPGLPDGGFPSTPGGIPGSVGDIVNGGLESVLGGKSSPVPSIFKDILNGNMMGILETLLGVLTSQNEIFDEMSKVVLGDGWEAADGDGNAETPPNPYRVRLPQDEADKEVGLITRSPIVLRRDKANQYDQELSRAMAAPMLAEEGNRWLEAQITTSSDMMQAGLASTQSAIAKAGEATEATSTQEIVRRSAEIAGVAATLQMQEMQQNAMLGESLWNMQRLESAQLQLAANASEAADEQNRRDRASRAINLYGSANEAMIIPGIGNTLSSVAQADSSASERPPEARSLFSSD
ncbi:MAG: hypothetical protein AAFP20_00730 [Cyanobacteria bacterium J06614_10]